MVHYEIHNLDSIVHVNGLINVAYYKLPKNFVWAGEAHNFWELLYVDKGELLATAGMNNYLLKAGEMVFHCPNEFHNLRCCGDGYTNVIVVSFLCCSPMMEALEHQILTLNNQERACLSSIVKEAEGSFVISNEAPCVNLIPLENAPSGGPQVIKNLLEYLLILIYRRGDGIRFDTRAVPMNQMHHHVKIVVQVQDYLHEHYFEKITLESLASLQNISVSQLKRIFKEQTGVSVITYLTNYRIGEAKRLIQESNLNFSQIALAVGYDNIYYFSTIFKKHTGMTPTEYSKSLLR